MWFNKKKFLPPPPPEINHIPCLYEVTTVGPDGNKQLWEVIATSPKDARTQVLNAAEPLQIVRTFREGFVE